MHSPIGERVGSGGGRRTRVAEYRRERDHLDPFEGIARQVIVRRGELGLSQEELAVRVGTSRSAISRLERGQHRVSTTMLARVAKALDLRVVMTSTP